MQKAIKALNNFAPAGFLCVALSIFLDLLWSIVSIDKE
jgi:hypothetical protein